MRSAGEFSTTFAHEAACMPDDVVLNKVSSLERCITRIREVYAGNDANLYRNLTAQESILLNLQRACEVSIDLAMHVVRKRHFGVPPPRTAATRFRCCKTTPCSIKSWPVR